MKSLSFASLMHRLVLAFVLISSLGLVGCASGEGHTTYRWLPGSDNSYHRTETDLGFFRKVKETGREERQIRDGYGRVVGTEVRGYTNSYSEVRTPEPLPVTYEYPNSGGSYIDNRSTIPSGGTRGGHGVIITPVAPGSWR